MCLMQRALPAADGLELGPKLVMIIRHGEKPDENAPVKDKDLSPQGRERSHALVKVFGKDKEFPKPDVLIAARHSKHSNRSAETINPLAAALGKKIDATYDEEDYAKLARAILTERKYAGKTILIAWHHNSIPPLAHALGAKDAPDKWKGKSFDRVWELRFADGAVTFKNLPQKALPGDAEE